MTAHPTNTQTSDKNENTPQNQHGRQASPAGLIHVTMRVIQIAILVSALMLLIGSLVPDTAYGRWIEPWVTSVSRMTKWLFSGAPTGKPELPLF